MTLCSLWIQLIVNYKYTTAFLFIALLELTKKEDKPQTIKQQLATINKKSMDTTAGTRSIMRPHKLNNLKLEGLLPLDCRTKSLLDLSDCLSMLAGGERGTAEAVMVHWLLLHFREILRQICFITTESWCAGKALLSFSHTWIKLNQVQML